MRELAWKYSPDIRQIDLDVNRTYREHIMFRDRYSSKQQVRTRVYCSADNKKKQNSTDSKKNLFEVWLYWFYENSFM